MLPRREAALGRVHFYVETCCCRAPVTGPSGLHGRRKTADEGAPAASENASGESAAVLEMAVSETCADDSSSQCVLFQGENILINPADFERVGVDSAASSGPRMIDVTLDSDGAEVVQKLSTEASEAGESARLVTKSDGDILSAVRVQGSLQGESLQMAVPEDVGAVAKLGQ